MNKSENIQELAKALVAAQKDLKNPGFDSTNPHFKNKYASLAGVRDVLTPVLAKHGLAAIQAFERAEGGISCETILMHQSGQWLSGTLFMPSVKQDAQGYGSAITYARRYSLMAICGVVGDEDDDGANASKPKANANELPPPPALTKEQKINVENIASPALDLLNSGEIEKAYDFLEKHKLEEMEEKLYLWSFFDSKMRTALKKIDKVRRPFNKATGTYEEFHPATQA